MAPKINPTILEPFFILFFNLEKIAPQQQKPQTNQTKNTNLRN